MNAYERYCYENSESHDLYEPDPSTDAEIRADARARSINNNIWQAATALILVLVWLFKPDALPDAIMGASGAALAAIALWIMNLFFWR